MTIIQAFDTFNEQYLTARMCSPNTHTGYSFVIGSLLESSGNKDISTFEVSDLHKWVAHMQEKGNTQTTIVSNLSRIRVFIGFLNEAGLCPLKKKEIFVPKKPQTLPKLVSPETVTRMIDSCSTIRDRALISFLFSTGIRNSELRNLKQSQISGNEVYIKQGKGLRDRVTFIDTRTKNLLDVYLLTRLDNCPYLFCTQHGTKIAPSSLRYIVAHAAKGAGVGNVSPHMFRHGVATHLMKEGMPSRMIQKFLGHSNLATTEIYMHVTDQDLQGKHSQILSAKRLQND